MIPTNGLVRAAAKAALLCSLLPCQEPRLLDGSGIATATYDAVRGRVVAIGYDLETREFDGSRWRMAPQPLPTQLHDVQVVFDAAHRRTLACRAPLGSPLQVEQYDGIEWRSIPTTSAPPERHAFGCVHDTQRGELLLFGGIFGGAVPTNETWTFDGTTWTQHTTAVMPSPNIAPMLCFDAARGRTVLFDGSPLLGTETWEWDGAAWSRVVTATAPPARGLAAMGYDPSRGRVVLFGGVTISPLDDLWEYDGVDWQQQLAPNGPGARYGAMCVYDGALGEMRVFGNSFDTAMASDMWSWNGTRWLQHAMPPHPGSRGVLGQVSAAIADPNGDGLIVYNPTTTGSASTWRFDATGWHLLPGAAPSNRVEAIATSSAPRGYLHGGVDPNSGAWLTDLWSFDGTTWRLEAVAGPSPRIHHAIAHDPARGELVLYGGVTTQGISDETWVFDGTGWNQRHPVTSPTAREFPMLACDLVRSRIVLAGGNDGTVIAPRDTWEWDGVNWTQVTTAISLPSTYGRLAFDLQRLQLVLVHGDGSGAAAAASYDGVDWTPIALTPSLRLGPFDAVGFPYADGLLLADSARVAALSITAAQVAHYGSACTAGAPDLGANTWPRLGAAHHGIDVVGAPAGSFVALLGALQSANVAIGGCTQLVQQGQAVLLLATSTTGFATAPLPLPNRRAFLGLDLFFQVAAAAPASPAGFTLSRGLRLSLGD